MTRFLVVECIMVYFFLYTTSSTPTKVWRRILRDQRVPSFLVSSENHGPFVKSILFYASRLGLMHSFSTVHSYLIFTFISQSFCYNSYLYILDNYQKWCKSSECHPQCCCWKILSTWNSHFQCLIYVCIKFDFCSYFLQFGFTSLKTHQVLIKITCHFFKCFIFASLCVIPVISVLLLFFFFFCFLCNKGSLGIWNKSCYDIDRFASWHRVAITSINLGPTKHLSWNFLILSTQRVGKPGDDFSVHLAYCD